MHGLGQNVSCLCVCVWEHVFSSPSFVDTIACLYTSRTRSFSSDCHSVYFESCTSDSMLAPPGAHTFFRDLSRRRHQCAAETRVVGNLEVLETEDGTGGGAIDVSGASLYFLIASRRKL